MDNFLEKIKNKNIHVVGVSGTEGGAVLEFLSKNGIKNITAHDFSADKEELKHNFLKTHLWIKKKPERLEEFEKILKLPAKLNLKNEYLEGIADADIIFAPSSWRLYKPNFPLLESALEKGIEFGSITKLYFQLAKGKIISVTGTKGKGTTSRLIYDILLRSAENSKVYLAGNDRRTAQELDKIAGMEKDDILILETSNRQLMLGLPRRPAGLGKSPDIGVITNISPDHIDEHGSFENYIEAKKSLFKHSEKGNIAVLNYDNKITKKIGEELAGREIGVYFFSRAKKIKKGAFIENGKIYILGHSVSKLEKEYICDLTDIKLIGEHNIENVLAAVLVGYLAGAKPAEIKVAVQNFRGLPHRLEFIGEHGKVRFYDDLASTNPESTIAAIKALFNFYKLPVSPKLQRGEQTKNHKLILIAGGDDKGMDYAGLVKEILEKVDSLILLPGTGGDKLKSQITNHKSQAKYKTQITNSKQRKFEITECENFNKALKIIKAQTKAGDIVLISPASAHFQARYIDVLKKPIRNIIVEKFS